MKKNLFKFTRPGSALVIAVIMVLLLFIMGFGLLDLSSNARVFAIRQGSAITARAAADAGINKAIKLIENEYANNPTAYNPPNNPSSLCSNSNVTGQGVANGTFTLSTPVSSYSYTVSYDSNNKWYQIDCAGTAGPWQKTEHARVKSKSRFLGIALGNSLVAQNNDKFYGIYPPDPNVALLVKTNSTAVGAIDLSKSTIYGDVAVGAGGDPTKVITNPNSVMGTSYASTNFVYPPVQAPTGPAGPALVKGSCTITAAPQPGQAYQYSTINASGTVTINPNLGNVAIYVSGAMNISNIVVSQGSSLSLYIGQNLSGTNNVAITNNNLDGSGLPDATKVMIFGTAGVTSVANLVDFKNNANVYAGIYAPGATVQLKNNGHVYGAVIANNLDLKNNDVFYYNPAFYNLELAQFGVAPFYLDVLSWWE